MVRQLFESVLYGASDELHTRWLAGAAELAKPMFDTSTAHQALDADDATYAHLHGLYWLCCNMAHEQPLLICVDDAHWSDDPSVKFLSFIGRRLEDVAMLVLVGTRPDDEALSTQLPTLVADPGARRLDLAPLSDRAVTDWVRSALGADAAAEFCRACHGATSGNPLLMRELIREVSSERVAPTAEHAARVEALGSHGVSAVVLLRLARLPPGARELARAVAVLGDTANLSLARALAGLADAAASSAAEALLRAEILVGDDGLSFVHPIVRAAIYENISAVDRPDHHARAARLLAQRRCSPQAIAAQLLEMRPPAPSGSSTRCARRRSWRSAWAIRRSRSPTSRVRWPSRRPSRAARRRWPSWAGPRRAPAPRTPWSTSSRRSHSRPTRAKRPRPPWSSGLLKFAGDSVRAVDVLGRAQARLGDDAPDLSDRLEGELIGCAYISVSARRCSRQGRQARGLRWCAADVPRALQARRKVLRRVRGGQASRSRDRPRHPRLRRRRPAHRPGLRRPRLRERGDRAHVLRALRGRRAPLQRHAPGRPHARLGSLVRDGREPALARQLSPWPAGRRGGRRARGAEPRRRGARLAGLPLGGAGDADLLVADRGTVDAALVSLADTFLVEQATDNLPYSHAIHSRASLHVWAGELQRGLDGFLASGRRELEWERRTRPSHRGARAPRSSSRSSATVRRHAVWRPRRWRWRARSARRAAWGRAARGRARS